MPLFAFLDEAGEYTFHNKSGSYLVYTGIVTSTPALFSQEFACLKYELLTGGRCLERFHASEDEQLVRNRVFDILENSRAFSIHSIIVRKNRVHPNLRKYGVYSIAYRTMLRYLRGNRNLPAVHIIVDTVPDRNQQRALEQTLKVRATEALIGIPFSIDHHSSGSHALLQVADYCCWAIYKRWQSGDARSYERIRKNIRNEFDIFANGTEHYY